MAIEHILSDADTIQGIGVKYNVPWNTIVDYNSLEYPYTLTSLQAYNELYASGYITVTRALYASALTFYAGSTFLTEVDAQGIQRAYELVENTTIPAGADTGYLYVRCTNFGTFGNTIPNSVILPGKLNTSLGANVSALVITNQQAFANGTDATVRVTGQPIYIPTSEDTSAVVAINADSYITKLGGEDLMLSPDGDLLDDGFGDLGSAVGMENIQQSVNHRLTTRRGSITQHPSYGSRLHELIGMAQAPYVKKLLELDVHETLLYDDRITGVSVNSIEIVGTSLYIDLDVTVQNTQDNFKLALNLSGG